MWIACMLRDIQLLIVSGVRLYRLYRLTSHIIFLRSLVGFQCRPWLALFVMALLGRLAVSILLVAFGWSRTSDIASTIILHSDGCKLSQTQ